MLEINEFKHDLLKWFDENQRQMPWRETKNPYYIWLSEVMLQQTQVNTVRPYYNAFIERFPTIEALSTTNEEDVLKYWEGLGYYSRVRNFHEAVKEVHNKYNGKVPDDPESFQSLKGVGPYTNAAVMSIVHNHPLPAVDGNVLRVWSRLTCNDADIAQPKTKKLFEKELQPFVETKSGDFNQAMMELGATICTPKKPICILCPVQKHCEAFAEGVVSELPVKKKKIKKKTIDYDVLYITNREGQILIRKRDTKLLNGMWEFPMFEQDTSIDAIEDELDSVITIENEPVIQTKHVFTHMTWNMKVYKAYMQKENIKPPYKWMNKNEKDTLSFSTSMTKIFTQMNQLL
ncbi:MULTISPECIES: A/G-specific adenine glycosylase [Mammaliicoccus]|uniref:Adenine DNA glycosylase n=1 Tax=Mammaliicoccus lentus TaxID=42858 RepID=A0ABS6GZ68_MAMLE|nr:MULTISPECIES: A/G-specific adenine glycosylase [Mammaliicoccus]MBF0750425.1 A/G-specific adenine glycosylase [Mammaliicoccus lentus]MBF0840105.1 A/G-specific adenine glycosylase [Mammaliicoccus lentus]MBU6114444.1 A/G-specific adenine glycosylase [Mammaliicoccus lentus]MEB8091588.1 A/G-specific adenine glycosylase [Mammaliicoccus lentus]OAO19371.1 A/G-specific adenine glycosylase [Mammaliicoccus lentus]